MDHNPTTDTLHMRKEQNIFLKRNGNEADKNMFLPIFFRSYMERRRYKETLRKVIKVQSIARRWIAARQLHRLKLQHNAATCIQMHFRYDLSAATGFPKHQSCFSNDF